MKKNLIINGKVFAYYDAPGSSNKTLIFVHGNSLSATYFRQILQQSALNSFRRIAIDLPGHGDSNRRPNYHISDFTSALVDLIRELSIDDYVLIGHSFGGHVITQALPDLRPSAVVLVGTPPLQKPLSTEAFLPFPLMNLFYQEVVNEADLRTLFQCLKTSSEFIKDFQQTDPVIRSSLAEIVTTGSFVDEVEALLAFKGRIALIVGDAESIVSPVYVQRIAQITGSTFKTFGGDHHFLLDQPEAFSEFIANFMIPSSIFISTSELLVSP
jgi:pimeloyl-ACP methyl ester carboxylesterase